MNLTEREMLDRLKRGRDEFGVIAVKGEFEAEGSRPDEFLRLMELTFRADLKLALKIGGCEAVTDLFSSRDYGVDYIIAPMVETPYALRKFVEARDKVYGDGDHQTEFLFNLETESTLRNLDDMVPVARGQVNGIVFGRVDYTLSCGLERADINSDRITNDVLRVAKACLANDLELVVGGGVSAESVPHLRAIRDIRLDRFETRKVVFDGAMAHSAVLEDALANAVAFELAWLKNKRDRYQAMANEDRARIAMMEARVAPAAKAEVKKVA